MSRVLAPVAGAASMFSDVDNGEILLDMAAATASDIPLVDYAGALVRIAGVPPQPARVRLAVDTCSPRRIPKQLDVILRVSVLPASRAFGIYANGNRLVTGVGSVDFPIFDRGLGYTELYID